MKISRVLIQNFKGISSFEYNFVDSLTKEVRPITALFGDNGSGKTTVLQAIAFIVSLATGKTKSSMDFQWFGFLPDRVDTLGETMIQVDLLLDEDEINATHEIFEIWKNTRPVGFEKEALVSPGRDTVITLEYKGGQLTALGDPSRAAQLLGIHYLEEASDFSTRFVPFYKRIGEVYWFDQYRNLGSRKSLNKNDTSESRTGWQEGVEALREYLILLWTAHQNSPDEFSKDLWEGLESGFSKVFPGSKFVGITKKPIASGLPSKYSVFDFYFLISRDGRKYDIGEMSSGEQAVFSVLFEFVIHFISKSIVLIDELELHLHPLEQQAMYNSLRKIGPDCQFIITSHSPYLRDIIPEDCQVRLEGGRLCL